MYFNKRVCKALVCFVLIVAVVIFINKKLNKHAGKTKMKSIACYYEHYSRSAIQTLNYEELADPSRFDKNIFFLETSCSKYGVIELNPRQACAIESAARMNRNMTVYLMVLSPYPFSDSAQKLVDRLSTYLNVHIRRIFMDDFVKNTPLEKWWSSGVFETSKWPTEHMADVLRLLTLWKFPGIYLDLDVVVISSLEDLKDFVGTEGNNVCSNGVMRFGTSEISRTIAALCLERIRTNFRGTEWTRNGPVVITKVLSDVCGTNNTSEMTRDRCSGFTVHPPSMFYPIHYQNWLKYFEPDVNNETMKKIRKSRVIHVWNKLSHSKSINLTEEVPYTIIARQYCPRIFSTKWE